MISLPAVTEGDMLLSLVELGKWSTKLVHDQMVLNWKLEVATNAGFQKSVLLGLSYGGSPEI